jgi:hypothetical protein
MDGMYEQTEAFIERHLKLLALVPGIIFLLGSLVFVGLLKMEYRSVALGLLYLLVPAYLVSSLSAFYLIHRKESRSSGWRRKAAEWAKIGLGLSIFLLALVPWGMFMVCVWEPAKRNHQRMVTRVRKIARVRPRPIPPEEDNSQVLRPQSNP